MSLFHKQKEPVFLKESSDAKRQLEVLRKLEPQLTSEGKKLLSQDIKKIEYGIAGEEQIAFELKSSHMPIYVLHDIYLECGELNAQIDYLVITRKLCFVLECKNLYGNIEITNSGDFIRTVDFGGRRKKEGIYSPITQNQRHMDLLKKAKVQSKGNIFLKLLTEKNFEDTCKAIVVLANPKTILNAKYAKKEIKDKVIRSDQLIRYIRQQYNESKEAELSDEQLKKWAESFLKLHHDVQKDYTAKYKDYLQINENKAVQNTREKERAEKPESTELNKDVEAPANVPAKERAKVPENGEMDKGVEPSANVPVKERAEVQENGEMDKGEKTPANVPVKERTEVQENTEIDKAVEGLEAARVKEAPPAAQPMQTKADKQPETETLEDTELFQKLKEYRLKKSKEEQVKPYYIYNNLQLKDIIEKMPRSKEELLKVSGFGAVKTEKYGDDILAILKEY